VSVLSALAAIASALLATMGPGTAVLAAAGLRGWALAALAPAVGTAVLTAGAVGAGLVGMPWAWPAALVATIAAGGIALGLRRGLGRPDVLELPRRDRTAALLAWGAAGVAALLAVLPLRAGMGGIRGTPRTPDAELHHGLLRAIESTGQGSPLAVLDVGGVDGAGTRPGGWHDVVAAAMSLFGTDAVVAANVSALVLAGVIIPLGMGYLCAALLPRWSWAGPLGAVVSTAFVSLPTVVVSFGTLWPFAWATGLLPAVLGGLVLVLRARRLPAPALAVLAVAVAGVGAAQFRALGSVAVLALPLLVGAAMARWLRLQRAGDGRRAVVEGAALVGVAVLAVVGDVLLTAGRPPAPPRIMSAAQATGEALFDTPFSEQPFGVPSPAWFLGAAAVVGFVVALRTPGLRAWAVSWAAAVTVYAISASAPTEHVVRRAVTSWWFDDPMRLTTLIPIAAAPLVVIAADGLRSRLATTSWATYRHAGLILGLTAMAAALLLSLGRAEDRQDRMWFDYAPRPEAEA
jgi:hypothetical protein